ncbi:MAG: IS256 family transposase [Actinomycetota bacterium]|nr:IS256 family transposase [Actinomycetota bacterium]MCL6092410.1 IS256 family transposase [Actinomycetota bacterium]MDA8166335.1 IS256 family transposase [Actinomycetota bacterium]
MSESNVVPIERPAFISDPLTEMLRRDARELLMRALEVEVAEYLALFEGLTDEQGRAAVVRNGYLPVREILTGIGPVPAKVPKVRSRTDEQAVFHSTLVPPYLRKAKSVEAAIPWLYLKGISTGQMQAALEVLMGPEARGLSPAVVSRLKKVWLDEYLAWSKKRLDDETWVYLWADGIYSGIRAESQKLCLLVVVGVNDRGEKHFLAIEDGVRESTQSWREVLLDLKSRGLNAPALGVADGALGFWGALDEIFPETRHQRCWKHKIANVLNYLPKHTQPKAKEAIHEIWMAETKDDAVKAFDLFIETYQDKYPKAAECLVKDRTQLLAFYDFPAVHWQHIRTTNPIESTFATIRHRSKQAKGCVTRQTMLAMAFKLGMCAEGNWRRLRGFDHLAKVINGVKFKDGIEIENQDRDAA